MLWVWQRGQFTAPGNALAPRTFPRAFDVEVMTFQALEHAWKEDDNPAWREHVTPCIYRHPEAFRLLRVPFEKDLSHLRWTADEAEGLLLVRKVYKEMGWEDFSWLDVLRLFERVPALAHINSRVQQKRVP